MPATVSSTSVLEGCCVAALAGRGRAVSTISRCSMPTCLARVAALPIAQPSQAFTLPPPAVLRRGHLLPRPVDRVPGLQGRVLLLTWRLHMQPLVSPPAPSFWSGSKQLGCAPTRQGFGAASSWAVHRQDRGSAPLLRPPVSSRSSPRPPAAPRRPCRSKPGTYGPDPKAPQCKLCAKGFQCPTSGLK